MFPALEPSTFHILHQPQVNLFLNKEMELLGSNVQGSIGLHSNYNQRYVKLPENNSLPQEKKYTYKFMVCGSLSSTLLPPAVINCDKISTTENLRIFFSPGLRYLPPGARLHHVTFNNVVLFFLVDGRQRSRGPHPLEISLMFPTGSVSVFGHLDVFQVFPCGRHLGQPTAIFMSWVMGEANSSSCYRIPASNCRDGAEQTYISLRADGKGYPNIFPEQSQYLSMFLSRAHWCIWETMLPGWKSWRSNKIKHHLALENLLEADILRTGWGWLDSDQMLGSRKEAHSD